MKQEINRKSLRLLKFFYKVAQKKIIKKLQSGKKYNKNQRDNILEGVRKELQTLDKKTKKWVDREVERNYRAGSEAAYIMLKSVEDKAWQKEKS